jgi:transcriptional regulator with XRE-family HTH domain
MSQLALATQMETTSRHTSFLETGRSNPSHEMILRVSDALDIPFRERNLLFQAAGFKAHYRLREFNESDMSMMTHAIGLILKNHEPFPGFVLDRYWNLLNANAPGERMLRQLVPGFDLQNENTNLLLAMFTNQTLINKIQNWHELVKHLIQRIKRESFDDTESYELINKLREKSNLPEDYWDIDLENIVTPVMPMVLKVSDECTLSMLSTITTFGTPVDVMAQETRIELVFPADAFSEDIMRQQAGD